MIKNILFYLYIHHIIRVLMYNIYVQETQTYEKTIFSQFSLSNYRIESL